MEEGECCSGFGERVCQFITENGDLYWKLRATREERESES